MIATNSITDLQRAEFLEKLIAETRADNALIPSDFEDEFLASYQAYSQYHVFFNAGNGGRRAVCDKMWMRYGNELKMPWPQEVRSQNPGARIFDADANGCQFLIFNDSRRQVCCNEPATKQRQNGFRYCASHAEQVERDCKRRGKAISLTPFNRTSPRPSPQSGEGERKL